MAKAQHTSSYKRLPLFLKTLRESAGITQRDIGRSLKKPQSWVFNCESANRRVDLAEFILWCEACGIDPKEGFERYLKSC